MTHDFQGRSIRTLKNATIIMFVLTVMVLGAYNNSDRTSYWTGAGFLLLSLAIPVIIEKLYQRVALLRHRRTDDDEAVSPVIAVILMVAITVVLAAVVYMWVSGFTGGQQQAGTMSLTMDSHGAGYYNLTVVSASPSLKWDDVRVTMDGTPATFTALTGSVNAGDTLRLTGYPDGGVLRLIQTSSNTILVTMTLQG
jgi:flagellin-like protein